MRIERKAAVPVAPIGRRGYAIRVTSRQNRSSALVPAAALSLLLLTACGATEPFIDDPRAFDRTAPGFGQEPEDITEVAFCFSSTRTALDDIVTMAEARCAEFGREARYTGGNYHQCPLLTPRRAEFDCVRPDEAD
ncbi:MAG: hypothetical protein EA405_08040 [Rhodospirillales bacterium]|nr:MAG: hypothetical protein EA405_08040 [Rhodospirillales bacterium]